jgi:hypothetical protein
MGNMDSKKIATVKWVSTSIISHEDALVFVAIAGKIYSFGMSAIYSTILLPIILMLQIRSADLLILQICSFVFGNLCFPVFPPHLCNHFLFFLCIF